MGGEERLDGVGIFVAEKWVDSVVSVERHSKSTDFEDGLRQWFIKRSYSLCSSLIEEEKEFLECSVPFAYGPANATATHCLLLQ